MLLYQEIVQPTTIHARDRAILVDHSVVSTMGSTEFKENVTTRIGNLKHGLDYKSS